MSRLPGPAVLILAAVLLAGALLAGLAFGAAPVPLGHLVGILGRALGLPVEATWRAWEATVILDLRLPRVLVGALVGGGLAVCGAALQGLFRNPLASPDVLGVSSGATVGAVLAIYAGAWLTAQLHLSPFSVWLIPGLACVCAGATAFLVYAIATRRGHTPLGTLLLAGIAVASLNGALTALILSLALADYQLSGKIIEWLLGGLDARTWEHVRLAAPAVLLGCAFILAYARDLDALLLGETQAASVGVDVPQVRRRLLLATSLVTGAAVAVSGAIGFVGLVIPHVLRLLVGPGHRWLLPSSLLVGASFLVLTDLLARTAIAPEEIRLGVLTAAVGAPFFLFLLLQRRKEGMW